MTASSRLLHLALPEDWQLAVVAGSYGVSTRGATIAQAGFMHASSDEDQALRVWELVYADRSDVLVLETDRAALEAAGFTVRDEPGDPADPGSERFPHVYGGDVPTRLLRVRPGGIQAAARDGDDGAA